MKVSKVVAMVAIVSALAACGSSPEKQKAKAEARNTDEQTKTMQEYKSCIKKAKSDQEKLDICDRILKANE